ncbi:MAG TPA: hypothetical protein VK492_09465 [Chitinophagaceae bacterium]|nr:hypothetical protein [Chitinophagaceae bacterium]
MKHALAILFFQGFISTLAFGQNTKDYRAVTTKYSDGTTLTLGGYGDPSQYSFSNKSSTGSDNGNSSNITGGKSKSKKDDKELRIELIEWGKIWTSACCDDCKENKSRKAYKKFVELVNEKRYGEALDLKQYEVNENFTEEKPDEMSLYRYHGLVIFCERQCILKYPDNEKIYHSHNQGIQRATRRINSQLEKDLAKPRKNINEYKLQVYSIAGIYDEAKKIYSAMEQAGEKVDKAILIAVELQSSKPDEALIIKNTNAIFEEKLKTIKAYTPEQSSLRVTDEAALGSFLVEILYTLSQVEHSIRTAGLQSLLTNTYDNLNASFTTAEGKERLLLAKAYFTEFGI